MFLTSAAQLRFQRRGVQMADAVCCQPTLLDYFGVLAGESLEKFSQPSGAHRSWVIIFLAGFRGVELFVRGRIALGKLRGFGRAPSSLKDKIICIPPGKITEYNSVVLLNRLFPWELLKHGQEQTEKNEVLNRLDLIEGVFKEPALKTFLCGHPGWTE